MINRFVTVIAAIGYFLAEGTHGRPRELEAIQAPLQQTFIVKERTEKLPFDPNDPENPLRFNPANLTDNDYDLYGNYRTVTDAQGNSYFRMQWKLRSIVPFKSEHVYQAYAQMYDSKTSQRISLRYYEDVTCSLKYDPVDCGKERLTKRAYKVAAGCGAKLIKYLPDTPPRHFLRRTNKASKRCAAWLPNSDNHFQCAENDYVATCTTLRPFITKASRIRMKNDSTYKFQMGFYVFLPPKYITTTNEGHGDNLLDLRVLDEASLKQEANLKIAVAKQAISSEVAHEAAQEKPLLDMIRKAEEEASAQAERERQIQMSLAEERIKAEAALKAAVEKKAQLEREADGRREAEAANTLAEALTKQLDAEIQEERLARIQGDKLAAKQAKQMAETERQAAEKALKAAEELRKKLNAKEKAEAAQRQIEEEKRKNEEQERLMQEVLRKKEELKKQLQLEQELLRKEAEQKEKQLARQKEILRLKDLALAEEEEARIATEEARLNRIAAKKKLLEALQAAEELKKKHAEREKLEAARALKLAEQKAKQLEQERLRLEKLALLEQEKALLEKAKAEAEALELLEQQEEERRIAAEKAKVAAIAQQRMEELILQAEFEEEERLRVERIKAERAAQQLAEQIQKEEDEKRKALEQEAMAKLLKLAADRAEAARQAKLAAEARIEAEREIRQREEAEIKRKAQLQKEREKKLQEELEERKQAEEERRVALEALRLVEVKAEEQLLAEAKEQRKAAAVRLRKAQRDAERIASEAEWLEKRNKQRLELMDMIEQTRKVQEQAEAERQKAAWATQPVDNESVCEGGKCEYQRWWVQTSEKWADKITDLFRDLDEDSD